MRNSSGRSDIDASSFLRKATSDLAERPQKVQLYEKKKKKKRAAIRRSAGGAILLRGLTSHSPVFFILAQLYKQIQIRTSEFSRQQVLVLLLRRTPDSSVSLQAIPARTPLQWGGNWTDHTLFTHYAAKMKWAVPKHTVTGRGGRRSLFHQWHIF